ncbi:MAG: cupin domain-containing protein [Solirubrobacterales bacterium]|nr:cupin domain-containing protein [Solirubrobacterales bacterium]
MLFRVRGQRTNGTLTAFETTIAPGTGPPSHAKRSETLYVIDGEVRFKLGDHPHDGGAGAFVFIPRVTEHAFVNIGKPDAGIRSTSPRQGWTSSTLTRSVISVVCHILHYML